MVDCFQHEYLNGEIAVMTVQNMGQEETLSIWSTRSVVKIPEFKDINGWQHLLRACHPYLTQMNV